MFNSAEQTGVCQFLPTNEKFTFEQENHCDKRRATGRDEKETMGWKKETVCKHGELHMTARTRGHVSRVLLLLL